MSKDCHCGGSCCTEEEKIPQLRKLIREMIENEMPTKYEIKHWYFDSDGEKDMGTKVVQGKSEEDAINNFLNDFPVKRKNIISTTKL